MNKNKINFSLPDFFYNFKLNKIFIELNQKYPQYFYDNFVISSVYGEFPYSIWGLRKAKKYLSKELILKILKYFSDRKISVHFSFENMLLEEKHLNDTFSNMCLKLANDKRNAVILNSLILRDYIKAKYSKFSIITDFNAGIAADIYSINDSVFDSNCIEQSGRKKYQVILNNPCLDECGLKDIHIKYLSAEQINFNKNYPYFPCEAEYNCSFETIQGRKNFISSEKLKTKYIEKGFNNFKISSEGLMYTLQKEYSLDDILKSYLYYMIKPEFEEIVRVKVAQEDINGR